jgi:hypothetical protein
MLVFCFVGGCKCLSRHRTKQNTDLKTKSNYDQHTQVSEAVVAVAQFFATFLFKSSP